MFFHSRLFIHLVSDLIYVFARQGLIIDYWFLFLHMTLTKDMDTANWDVSSMIYSGGDLLVRLFNAAGNRSLRRIYFRYKADSVRMVALNGDTIKSLTVKQDGPLLSYQCPGSASELFNLYMQDEKKYLFFLFLLSLPDRQVNSGQAGRRSC